MITAAQHAIYFKLPYGLVLTWAFVSGMATFMYSFLALPVLGSLFVALYWAVITSWFSTSHTACLRGYLLLGAATVTLLCLLVAVLIAPKFHVTQEYVPAAVYLVYIAVLSVGFYSYELNTAWRDFVTTRTSRRLDVLNDEVIWKLTNRPGGSAGTAFSGGLAVVLLTLLGMFIGKANAQAAMGLLCVIGGPLLFIGYGMRAFVGLHELRKIEKASGKRFPLPHLDSIQQARAESWIGRLINPKLRASASTSPQKQAQGPSRVNPRARK
jgi:hypothetical protein